MSASFESSILSASPALERLVWFLFEDEWVPLQDDGWGCIFRRSETQDVRQQRRSASMWLPLSSCLSLLLINKQAAQALEWQSIKILLRPARWFRTAALSGTGLHRTSDILEQLGATTDVQEKLTLFSRIYYRINRLQDPSMSTARINGLLWHSITMTAIHTKCVALLDAGRDADLMEALHPSTVDVSYERWAPIVTGWLISYAKLRHDCPRLP